MSVRIKYVLWTATYLSKKYLFQNVPINKIVTIGIVYIGSRQNNSVLHNHKNVLYYDISSQKPHITSYHLMVIIC